jgi:carbon monoxide dehydrogenase subunit G
MKIDGSFSIEASIDRVWSLITDPKCFAPCVPGCGDIEVLGPDRYQASVKVTFGPIKTTFVVVFEVVEQEAPVFWKLRVRGEEGGKASSLSADSEMRLLSLGPESTEVRYSSEVSVFGRLGKFGAGLMKKHAEKVSQQFAKSFGELARSGAAAVTSEA